ncbi:MAG: gliding motility-associated C-terminal domain-containing protein [Flavobacteriales bacterium]|nr:gliding motility-associated C-terminal domain-containing protein [Flavobacteriales bacterium]
MNEPLQNVFRERLAGHEMDVPGGAWEQIQGQLAAEAGSQALRESMQHKFQGHELPVDPSAWSNISTQLGHGMAAGSTFGTAWIAAGVGAVALTAGLLWWNRPEQMPSSAAQPALVVLELPPTASNTDPAVAVAPAEADRQNTEAAAVPLPQQLPTALRSSTEEPDLTKVAEVGPVVRKEAGNAPKTQAVHTVIERDAPMQQQEAQPLAVNRVQQQTASASPARTTSPSGDDQVTKEAPPSSVATDRTAQDNGEAPALDPFTSEVASGIFIPNVFSPQGDGVNDTLKVVASGYERAEVRVISAKTGNLVFESNNLGHMWTGRLANGDIAEEGYYRCVVVLTDPNGQTRIKTEVVRLYR